MRQTIRRMLPALLAIFAFSAVAASAAQAAAPEGPFFKVNAKRLESGQTAELKLTFGKQRLALKSSDFGDILECEGMKAKPGAKLIGSSGKNSGKFEGAFELTKCEWKNEEDGHYYKVASISTETLKGEVTYETSIPLEKEGAGRFWIDCGKGGKGASENGKIASWTFGTEGETGELHGGWRIELPSRVGSETEATSWQGIQRFGDIAANYQEASGKLLPVYNNLSFAAGAGWNAEEYGAGEPAVTTELASGAKWGVYTKA